MHYGVMQTRKKESRALLSSPKLSREGTHLRLVVDVASVSKFFPLFYHYSPLILRLDRAIDLLSLSEEKKGKGSRITMVFSPHSPLAQCSEEAFCSLFSHLVALEQIEQEVMSYGGDTNSYFMKEHLDVQLTTCTLILGVALTSPLAHLDLEQVLQGIENSMGQSITLWQSDERLLGGVERKLFFIRFQASKSLSSQDLTVFKKQLILYLDERVGHYASSVFDPRNEEEVLRNMVTLSHELRYAQDLPHVQILYAGQSGENLFFHVYICRIMNRNLAIDFLVEANHPHIRMYLEKIKEFGFTGQKYPKESSFSLAVVSKKPFLREDNSCDLVSCREAVLEFLKKALGPLRDFNGGMLSREKKAFESLLHFSKDYGISKMLVQNIFYRIEPHVMRTLLEVDLCKELVSLLSVSLSSKKKILMKKTQQGLLFLIKGHHERSLIELEKELLQQYPDNRYEWGGTRFSYHQVPHYGLFYCGNDSLRTVSFLKKFSQLIKSHLKLQLLREIAPDGKGEYDQSGDANALNSPELIANI